MAVARRDHTATLLSDGTVLMVGGTHGSAELYDPASGVFTVLGSVPFSQGVAAARLADGRVLVVGWQTAMIYDPTMTVFTETGSLNVSRTHASATLLPDGRVLVAGGQVAVVGGPQSLAVAAIYDPETGTFSLTGSLNADRSGHAAALLPNGKVLLVGGSQTTTPGFVITLRRAELYDPATGSFSVPGNTIDAHTGLYWSGLILLDNGKVLITGGAGGKAELFDPATGAFSATGAMTTPRSAGTATLLPNGQVLVAGGGPVVTDSAELYDPSAGAFTSTASMMEGRVQHTATLLSSGEVLVIGGFDGTGDLRSSEVFHP